MEHSPSLCFFVQLKALDFWNPLLSINLQFLTVFQNQSLVIVCFLLQPFLSTWVIVVLVFWFFGLFFPLLPTVLLCLDATISDLVGTP